MTHGSRFRYMTTVSKGALALAAPAVLLFAGSASAEAAGPTAAQSSTGRVEEVMVTARRPGENVQKVPIAISAISGQLKSADVRDVTDIVDFIPNVRIDPYPQRGGAAAITIRGISPSRLDDNSIDSPIGVLVDGIYLGTLVGQTIPNFDVDRIEVLLQQLSQAAAPGLRRGSRC